MGGAAVGSRTHQLAEATQPAGRTHSPAGTAALGQGGHVEMPIQETFWAKRFGMLTDRYGIPWMIDCEKPMQG